MKKSILSMIILLLSLSSYANTDWRLISKTTEYAHTFEEFFLLQQKYPEEFGAYDPTIVEKANITTFTYKYHGITTCAADDERLIFVNKNYGLCEVYPGGIGSCWQSASGAIPYGDPCLF